MTIGLNLAAAPPPSPEPEFAEIAWRGRYVRIEHQWLSSERSGTPLIVFLHEGLGSRAMWKDFPQRLCDACQCGGLVYSRPGYGRSTPRLPGETWASDFMHQQAHEVLPALLEVLGVRPQEAPLWLYGHSDGGSIALLFAARHPSCVAGIVVAAPHVFVEDVTVASIVAARDAYLHADLRSRLAKYHDQPDSAFWGWNQIWLSPEFRSWSIESELGAIRCPLFAVQGLDDEYGSLRQIHAIAQHVPHAGLLELAACAHSPHRDQPDKLIAAVTDFINHYNRGAPP